MSKSKRNTLLLICCFGLGWANVTAQSSLYVKPSLAGQFGMHRFDRSTPKSANFHTGSPDIELGAGVDLHLKINPRYAVSSGFHLNNYGFGYRIDIPNYGRKSGSTSDYYYSIPLLFHYTLANDIHWVPLDKANYYYLFVFRLYVVAGLSYDRVRQPGNYGQLTITGAPFSITDDPPVINRWNNVSGYLGIGFQFYNEQKDRIDVRLFATRGLSRIAYQDFDYSFTGGTISYQTRFWSRGSLVAFSVGYPIRLATFKKTVP